jgi:hypothetical protein
MHMKSPATLALAWVLAPVVVTVVSAGLGAGVGLLARVRLGALMIPTGFLTGVTVMVFLIEIGLGAVPTVILCLLGGITGGVAALRPHWPLRRPRLAWTSELAAWLYPALAGVAAFGVGMAPLVGSGRSGVLGYTLNNDPSVHITAIELIRDGGLSAAHVNESSYASVSGAFDTGYPLGSHVWPLFASITSGVEAFHVWSPLIALMLGFLALVTYSLLRGAGASPVLASVGGLIAAIGYLPFSYLAQGGAKEVAIALAVYATVALFVLGVQQAGVTFRGLVPSAIGASAAVGIFGLGALTWLGPAGVIAFVLLLWRVVAPSQRGRAVLAAAGALVVGAIVALPSVISSVRFVQTNDEALANPAQTGNLVGAVPIREVLNVWFAHDYRLPQPDHRLATDVGIVLAAGLVLIGIAWTLWKRRWGIPLALVAAFSGLVLITSRYAIYFDAKAYLVLAPALGMAAVMGVAALVAGRGILPILGVAAGLLVGAGVVASDALVYSGTWITPKDRFDELADLGERYSGQGPTLVNDREDYAKLFLRDTQPWESWGPWQPERGFRFGAIPPPPPRTPDFDDYTLDFMSRFKLLIQRKRPLGSVPPSNFRLVDQTAHYQVWKREGPMPAAHASIGIDTLSGSAPLGCTQPEVEQLIGTARREHLPILVSHGLREPLVSPADTWQQYGGYYFHGPGLGEATRRGGVALTYAVVKPGEYDVWIQGSFGPGLSLMWGLLNIGTAYGDLGLHSGWTELGRVRFDTRPEIVAVGGHKPWWQAGSTQFDTTGPVAFVPVGDGPSVRKVPPERIDSLCGRRVDWLELPATG